MNTDDDLYTNLGLALLLMTLIVLPQFLFKPKRD